MKRTFALIGTEKQGAPYVAGVLDIHNGIVLSGDIIGYQHSLIGQTARHIVRVAEDYKLRVECIDLESYGMQLTPGC